MSASGVDLRSPREVLKYINEHARSQTRASVERSDYFLDAFAALNGITRQTIEEMAKGGVNIRDPQSVRSYLASKRQPAPERIVRPEASVSGVDASGAALAPRRPTPAPSALPKPKAKKALDPREVLKARKDFFDKMSPEKQAEWSPEQKHKWLSQV